MYVSGNYKKANINPGEYPNVHFLGYLPEDLYYNNLFKAHVVIDLTTHENCLVCGAYEAMAASKPLVTSDTCALRQYFRDGAIFTQHDYQSIASAVRITFENRERLIANIEKWKNTAILEHNEKIKNLSEMIRAWL